MIDKNKVKSRIIEIAREKFKKFGYRKVTTDEIAHEVGISKRTLYELFSTKVDLVKEIVILSNSYIENIFKEIQNNKSTNPLQKINEITKFIRNKMSLFNIGAILKLRRDFPAIAKMAEDSRNKSMKNAYEIFKEGVDHGIFRKDIKPDLFFTLFQNIFDQFFIEEVSLILPYTLEEMMENLTKVVVQGLLTKEAIMNGYLDYLEN